MDTAKNFGESTASYMIAGANLHKAWTELKPLLGAMVLPPQVEEAIAKVEAAAEEETKKSVDLFVAVLQNASQAKRDAMPMAGPGKLEA